MNNNAIIGVTEIHGNAIKEFTTNMKIYGHRGAMALAPQNTIESFRLARDQGADGIELDVQVTADGYPVVFHDDTLDLLTNGHGKISLMPLAMLAELNAAESFGGGFNRCKIPLLREVIDEFGSCMSLNVELKTPAMPDILQYFSIDSAASNSHDKIAEWKALNESSLKSIVHELRRGPQGHGLAGYTSLLISSFDPFGLQAVHAMEPDLDLAFLTYSDLNPELASCAEELLGGVLRAWHPHYLECTAGYIEKHHRLNRDVNVWTVNQAEIALELLRLGVDGLITNDPAETRRQLISL